MKREQKITLGEMRSAYLFWNWPDLTLIQINRSSAAAHVLNDMDRNNLYLRLWLIWMALLIGGFAYMLLE